MRDQPTRISLCSCGLHLPNTTTTQIMIAKIPMAETTKIEKPDISRRAKGVFGLDLHSWEQLMLLSLGAAGLIAIAVFLTTAAVVILQRSENAQTKREFDEYKLEAGKSISEANARQKEAELKLAEVRKKLGRPRELDLERFKEALVGVAPRRVIISYAPNDPDSMWLSLRINGALHNAGWEASTLIEMPDGIRQCSNAFGGIYVLSRTMLPEEGKAMEGFMEGKPLNLLQSAFFRLPEALNASIEADSARFVTCPFISDDSLHVAIWPRWVIFPKEK
jgi:hypothetical protein